jgi:hypothetical protein
MRRILTAAILSAATAAMGCASPAGVQRTAYAHASQARSLEARGECDQAARERARSQAFLVKAQHVAYRQSALNLF